MKRLKTLRIARGWSGAKLCREAEIPPSLLSQTEHGMTRPYPVQLARIAKALDWTGEHEALLDDVDNAWD